MKLVNTYHQRDFDALVAAGMDANTCPVSSHYGEHFTRIMFKIEDEVFEKLDLTQNTIQESSVTIINENDLILPKFTIEDLENL